MHGSAEVSNTERSRTCTVSSEKDARERPEDGRAAVAAVLGEQLQGLLAKGDADGARAVFEAMRVMLRPEVEEAAQGTVVSLEEVRRRRAR